MGVNILNWGVPALVTVLVGTGAAVATGGAAIPDELQSRTSRVLSGASDAWATVTFDMRDARVSGTASSEGQINTTLQRVAQVHGVGSVTSDAVVADTISPYPFAATIADGAITLTGAVPDADARKAIEALAGQDVIDQLEVIGGAPDRASWMAAVTFALSQLRSMDEGKVALSDLKLTIEGRAKDAKSFDSLNLSLESPPGQVVLASREVEPALVSPYEWHVTFDGKVASVSGLAPDSAFAASLAALAPTGITVSTALSLASGAPEGYVQDAEVLLSNLLKLEQGTADISDGTLTLKGLPATAEVATSVTSALAKLGADVVLGPPRVTDFRFSAVKNGGRVVLTGYVPDDLERTRLGQFIGVDASSLQLGRGGPDHFQSAADLLMQAIAHLGEGRVSLDGTVLSIEGRATSEADYVALQATVGLGAPQGLSFGNVDLHPPLASPFTLTVEKAADGSFAFSGYAPSRDTEKAIKDAAGGDASGTLSLADGAPADFESSALKGLGVLRTLASGTLAFDGTSWSIGGSANKPEAADAAAKAYADAGLATAGWSYDVSAPEAVPVVPVVDPYSFTAIRAADGSVVISGYLPDSEAKKWFALRSRSPLADKTSLGDGAPDGFDAAARAGFDALMAMDQGTLSLSDGRWSLDGEVQATSRRLALEAVLDRQVDTSAWHLAIQAADAAPVVSPFRWAAKKSDDGRVTLSGYVPTEDLRRLIAIRAGKIASDASLVGSGEPAGFAASALAGLDALAHLSAGEVSFDGTAWSLSGQPQSEADSTAALAALDGVDAGGTWTTSLAAPPPVTTATSEAETPAPAMPVEGSAPAVDTAVEATERPAPLGTETTSSAAASVEPAPAENIAPTEEPVVGGLADTTAPAADGEQSDEAVASIEAPAAPDVPAATPNFRFEASKSIGGTVSFSGEVPAEPVRRELAEIVGAKPSADLAVSEGLPPDFAANADAGARALVALADGQFGLDGSTWVLSGRAVGDAQRQAALSSLSGATGPWRTEVSLLPPVDYCRAELTAFAGRNAILFQSGSARIADESRPALDELAGYLQLCPAASVDVEGHTDADGDADANLALSVDRALAVVDALTARGIGDDRLYAIGYGESLPIASNDTAAGKRANRRIAFAVHDEGQ